MSEKTDGANGTAIAVLTLAVNLLMLEMQAKNPEAAKRIAEHLEHFARYVAELPAGEQDPDSAKAIVELLTRGIIEKVEK